VYSRSNNKKSHFINNFWRKFYRYSFVLLVLFQISDGHTETFQGREYDIHIGGNTGAGAPAVFLLHGGKSDGKTLRRLIRFDEFADEFGVVAVYPSSPDKYWNDGRGVELGSEADRDDAKYLANLIEHLSQRGLVDPGRVYFAGISNGGGMSIRIACEYPELVAGIAVIATKLFRPFHCPGYKPIPALFFHGTEDLISPHEGRKTGREGRGFRNKGKTYSSQQTIDIWKGKNECATTSDPISIDSVPDDGTSVRLTTYHECSAPLKYYEIIGGGHTWPGARVPEKRFLQRLIGPTSQEVNAGLEALRVWLND